jgi:ComF family protein
MVTYSFIQQATSYLGSLGTHIMAPPYCAYCKIFLRKRTIFCDTCYAMIDPLVSVSFAMVKNYHLKVHALGAYQEPLQSLIRAKHKGDRIAARDLASLVCSMPSMKELPIDYVVPIPLHWTRYAWRGFNQAAEMAHVISLARSVPVAHLLKRHRRTQFQAALSASARITNVQGVFSLKTTVMTPYQGKHIVLVDDLMTTGVTLKEAALTLLPLKPASISAIVACRVI